MAGIYRDLASKGEPPAVPELAKNVRKIEPGTAWSGVPQLAAPVCAPSAICRRTPRPARAIRARYAGPIVDAVKRFQRRHGLDADGVIGAGTIRA